MIKLPSAAMMMYRMIFDHFCLMAFYLAQRVRTRHLFRILRDTRSSKSLLLMNVIDQNDASYTGHKILLQGVNMECSSIPLHIINLECDLIDKNKVTVGGRIKFTM